MKDFNHSLFAGALGKTNNPGGSKFMTVPLTRDISGFAYEIDYELTGEFVCCTLNGLLWLYENENNFNLIALKWNEETQKFEFAQSKTINKESVRARGIDWILLRNSFVLISNNQIKINTLLDTSEEKFLYSVLRAYQGLGDNGYFSTNYEGLYPVGTHQMEFCYSVLPAVGDYQIIEDFLIRRNSGTPQLYPLIPLEFNYEAEPTYGTGYSAENRGIQLAMINGELWGRGTKNIGKVSILPAVFNESGEPEEFYLYISPEYRQQSLSNNLAIIGTEKPIGFLSEKVNPVTGGTCVNSTSEEILDVENKEWINSRPNDNKQTTFDLTTGQGIALGEKGISFVKGDSYECKNLPNWIAPTGKLESISNKKIISSCDNALIKTNVDTGFNRDFINGNGIFSPYNNIFVNYEKNKFHITQLAEKKNFENISWNTIYHNAVKIELVNVIDIAELTANEKRHREDNTCKFYSSMSLYQYFGQLEESTKHNDFLIDYPIFFSEYFKTDGTQVRRFSVIFFYFFNPSKNNFIQKSCQTNYGTNILSGELQEIFNSFNVYRDLYMFYKNNKIYNYIDYNLYNYYNYNDSSDPRNGQDFIFQKDDLLCEIPDYVHKYRAINTKKIEIININQSDIKLQEKIAKILFSCKYSEADTIKEIYDFANTNGDIIIIAKTNTKILIFKADLDTMIFDFQAEYERSK